MALPMQDRALQKVRTPQERAVERRRSAEHNMVATAGSRLPSVDHIFGCAKPRLPGLLVNRLRGDNAFVPRRSGVDIHLDNAGIRRHADNIESRVMRRTVALDMHGKPQFARSDLGN